MRESRQNQAVSSCERVVRLRWSGATRNRHRWKTPLRVKTIALFDRCGVGTHSRLSRRRRAIASRWGRRSRGGQPAHSRSRCVFVTWMRRRGPSLNSCRPPRRRPSADGASRCDRTLRCPWRFQPVGASDPALPSRLRHVESHKQHPKRRRDDGRSRLQQFRMSQHCPRLRRAPRTIDDGMAIARLPHRDDRRVSRVRAEPIAPEAKKSGKNVFDMSTLLNADVEE